MVKLGKETQMKNPLLVLRISGTIKQILRILEVLLERERENARDRRN